MRTQLLSQKRKGFNLNLIIAGVLGVVVLSVLVVLGLVFLAKFKTTQNDTNVNSSIDKAISALNTVPDYLGLIITAIIFVALLGLIFFIVRAVGGSSGSSGL